jgi:inner membrane protein
MPTVMTHAVVGVALSTMASVRRRPLVWLLSATLPVLPDLDVLGVAAGVRFDSMWGHRGISHSLVTAALIGIVTAWLARRHIRVRVIPLALYFALITASHGVLDALTNGGPGVAFFAPLDDTRYFFPWRPIPVSPIAASFFTERGWHVFQAEVLLIWLPTSIVVAAALLTRRAASRQSSAAGRGSTRPGL